jgi:hypothetical protein
MIPVQAEHSNARIAAPLSTFMSGPFLVVTLRVGFLGKRLLEILPR